MSTPPLALYPLVWSHVSGSSPYLMSDGSASVFYSLDVVPPYDLQLTPLEEHLHRLDLEEKFSADFTPQLDLLPTAWLHFNSRLSFFFYAPLIDAAAEPGHAAHIKFFILLRWRLALIIEEEITFGEWFEVEAAFDSLVDITPFAVSPAVQDTTTEGQRIVVEKSFKSPCGFSSYVNNLLRRSILFSESQYRVEAEFLGYIEVRNYARVLILPTEPPTCEVVLNGSSSGNCDCCCCGGESSTPPLVFSGNGRVEVYAQTDNQGAIL